MNKTYKFFFLIEYFDNLLLFLLKNFVFILNSYLNFASNIENRLDNPI